MFEKKKYQIKAIALRLNITPRNIYANFFPIKAVSGSSFTLILSYKYQNKFSTFYEISFILRVKFILLIYIHNLIISYLSLKKLDENFICQLILFAN